MKPLSSSAQSILDAAVEGQAVNPARLDANLAAFEARLAAGDVGPDFDPGPPEPPAAPNASAIGTGAKIAGGLLVVGALALAFAPRDSDSNLESTRAAAPAVSVVAQADTPAPAPQPEPTAVADAPELVPAPEPDPAEGATLRTKVTKTDTSKRPKVVQDTTSSIDRLEEEMALMSDARRALGRGDARKALELLNKHGREFPKGEFRRERVVSRVTALCALGQEDAAKRVAKRYLAKDSTSVHAQRISQSCAATD